MNLPRPVACNCGIPHVKIRGGTYKYRMTAPQTESLQQICFKKPFCHCGTKAGKVTNTPILSGSGNKITFHLGYSWDGATGAIDSKNTHRGSLVHDGLYQLIRLGILTPKDKAAVDEELFRVLKQEGMWKIRRGIWRWPGKWIMGLGLRRKEKHVPCPP